MKRLIKLSSALIIAILAIVEGEAQTNTIQLRNGANSTTILPSASSTISVQIPALSTGTHYLLTSTTNPGSSGAAGSFLTYGATSAQTTTDISASNYLFNVGYATTAVEQNALGGLITATATGTDKSATALTLAATKTGTGTATALYITNGRLTFTDSDDSHITSFATGNQAVDINYTLPTTAGTSGQVLSTDGSGTLTWATATAVAAINDLTDAVKDITNFSNSMILGHQLTGTLSSASNNTAVGMAAMDAITQGDDNTVLGYNAATALTTGSQNVTIGSGAGSGLTTGSRNILIGYSAGSALTTEDDKLYIDPTNTDSPLIYGDFSGNTLTFNGAITTTGASALNGDITLGTGTSATGGSIIMHDNATGSSFTSTILSADLAASRNYTIPDAGADASFVMTQGAQTVTGTKTFASAAVFNTSAKLKSSDGTGGVILQAGAMSNTDVTYTLPLADGTSGYYMSTNGSGTLSWAANSLDNLSDAKSGGAQFGSSLILGHQTTGSLTNADANTAVGYGSLASITQGDDNTAIGETSLNSLTTTSRNTAIGAKAMRGATGDWNTFVGAYSGGPYSANSGSYNVGVGNDVMNVVTSGGNNVAIGYAAGGALTSGSSNVLLGYNAGLGVTTESNRLYVDNTGTATPLIYGEFDNDILRFNGRVGIGGTPGATYELDVVGDINYSGAISNTSDVRLKRNIQPLVNSMDVVQQLRPVSYEKRANLQTNDYDMKQMGFIAQELEKVLPNSVSTDKSEDAVKSVDYISLIPVLTKALQEQQQMINKQQAEIDELRQLIKRMSVR